MVYVYFIYKQTLRSPRRSFGNGETLIAAYSVFSTCRQALIRNRAKKPYCTFPLSQQVEIYGELGVVGCKTPR